MKNNMLFEMFPLVSFFLVYYFTKNIYTATLVCIIASWLQLILYKILYRKIGKNTWISTILITLFGGLTIALHNKTFVMLKPTMLYWIFGVSLFISARLNKNGIKLLLKDQIQLDDKTWDQVNLLWVSFFILMGALNLFIAFHFSEYVWVQFKVFGGFALMLLFTALTGGFIYAKSKGKING
ncbi:MAG: Inner rane-spanning protein YciB [Pseudomonadota bacterium]|jgi:intracellular septation protein|nr:septation protein IspZ [Burkholderiales bacterium]MBP9768451.1 septation protein IspZ [Burkholderiales bacterium]MDQ5947842.1 Inner rane-spanning protein YciB [Pseudomonadota bacterium]HCY39187.1 septation protein A [Neisseriales bacterium]